MRHMGMVEGLKGLECGKRLKEFEHTDLELRRKMDIKSNFIWYGGVPGDDTHQISK